MLCPMSALDELVRSWRANPDADGTIALCTALGGSGRKELMEEVRGVADAWHAESYDVMLAVGRMFLDAGALVEAQAALVSAGKADGRRFEAFRFLGEVLLRRGDAERAEKVFERAAQLGVVEPELARWQGRAQVYSALQRRVGADAVAKEVAKNEPLRPSMAPAAAAVDLQDLSVLDDLDRPLLPTNRVSSAAPAPPRVQPSVGRSAQPPPAKSSSGRESMPIFGNT